MSYKIAPLLLAALALTNAGCSGDSADNPGNGCTDMVGNACVGVPPASLCDSDYCTTGDACGQPLNCGQVVQVSNDAQLSAALLSVVAGDCIALVPGNYDAVALPAGPGSPGRCHAQRAAVGVDQVASNCQP